MILRRHILKATLSLFILFLSVRSFASDGLFSFRDPDRLLEWRLGNVKETRFTRDGLLLRGAGSVSLFSPDINIPSERNVIWISFKSRRSVSCRIILRTMKGRQVVKIIKAKFTEGSGPRQWRLYLGGSIGRDDYIRNIAINFGGMEEVLVTLDFIRFYRPTLPGLVRVLWQEFWEPDFIMGSTIGFVTTPRLGGFSFPTVLYVLIIVSVAAAGGFCFFIARGTPSGFFLKAAMAVFLVAGSLFAMRMDYNWLVIWKDDVRTLRGRSVEERIRIVNNRDLDNFFDFLDFIKRQVPPGKTVAPVGLDRNGDVATLARYYLLPVEESRSPDFLWSFASPGVRFELATGTLYVGTKAAARHVRPFRAFAANARIYEVIK